MHKRTNRFLMSSTPGILWDAEGDGGGAAAPPPASGDGSGSDQGGKGGQQQSAATYPANTAVEDMKPAEQTAYWKAHAQKWQGRAQKFDGLTDEQFAAMKDKATKHDALEHELLSDKDKAVADAKRDATAAALPRIVKAEFRAAAKGVLTATQLAELLEDLDLSKYADADGNPDETKIEKKVQVFAPVKPANRVGPSSSGLGSTPPGGQAGDQGRAMAAKRFGTKAAS